MTDRELLELAAKAAGIAVRWNEHPPSTVMVDDFGDAGWWDPLTDDGDALRLAVKLEIQAGYAEFSGEGVATWDRGTRNVREYGPDDPYAATRRAIVRAAAAIGEKTQ